VFDRLEDAIADLKLVFATTARPREVRLPVLTPREAASELHASAAAGLAVGMLFGGERAGLESADIALCQAIVTIPIDPRFRSLNLAQAVALNCYEWRMQVADAAPAPFLDVAEPADQKALLGLYGQLETELDSAGFFHPPEKTPGMVRNLRAIFARARLTDQEVSTLRGVVTALSRGRGRVLEKLARQKAGKID
jgi:tRNA/rRNA methyltransferase